MSDFDDRPVKYDCALMKAKTNKKQEIFTNKSKQYPY
jgi:hypothetical protein